ncbi:MAG: diguanylate cyclase [Candidatus Eremiobacteraeota bacterium]|nr:diguanylate cyclase [Candidatus Eremiobacteraeota bacterium]
MASIERYRDVSMTAARWLAETNSVETLFGRFCELLTGSLGQLSAYLAFARENELRIEFSYEGTTARHVDGVPVPAGSRAYTVLETGKAQSSRKDERRTIELPSQYEALYGAYQPVVLGHSIAGVFWITRVSRNAFLPDDLTLIEAVSGYLAGAIAENGTELATLQLQESAGVDSLTGVTNRRSFDHRLEAECDAVTPLSIIMFDIDHFHAYNEQYGPVSGDNILRHVAQSANNCFTRTADLFARYEGEKFVALLPRTKLDGAATIAERVRAAIYDLAIPHAGSPDGLVTISAGVGTCPPGLERTGAGLVELAQKALSAAKGAGRNRVAHNDDSGLDSVAAPTELAPIVLPVPTSRFFGREKELEGLGRLVDSERLVTIVGPGGIGKTRLALQAALHSAKRFPDAVRFADFGSVSNPDRVPYVVATALGIAVSAESAVVSQLLAFIEKRQMLLIFDNCEHLIAPCASLAEALLRSAPGVHILATAREALRLDGEITYALSPLSDEEAVQLFTERALAVDPNLILTEEDQSALSDLCTALDRIPMAIELAAARVNMFNVQQLLENLHDRFNLLSEGRRFASERQQTLWGLIDWSYRLLEEDECRLFGRLSVLAGEWTFTAVDACCFDEALPPEQRSALFSRLVAKSLVTTTRHPTGVRYRLLESIRDYADRKLSESGEAETIKNHHAAYFAAFVKRMFDEHDVARSDAFVAIVDEEYPNLRSALGWVNEVHDAELAAKLTSVLDHFWLARGQFREGHHWIERCLKMEASIPAALRVKLYRSFIRLSFYESDYVVMEDAATKAIALYTELGDRTGLAQTQNALGIVKHLFGKTEEAEALFQESLATSRELGHRRDSAHSLSNLGAIALDQRGDFAAAGKIFEECLQISRELGDRRGESIDLSNLGAAAFYSGNIDSAIQYSRQALKLSRDLQMEPLVGSELISLGRYELDKGNLSEAVLALKKGLGISRRQHNHEYIAMAIETFARVALKLGRFTDGVQMLAYAEKFRVRHKVPRLPFPVRETEDLKAALRKPLDDAAYERQWGTGERLTLAQVTKTAVNFLTRGKKTR